MPSGTFPTAQALIGCRRYFGVTKRKAGNGTRTRDPNLGKVVLYQLSYSRNASPTERNLAAVRSASQAKCVRCVPECVGKQSGKRRITAVAGCATIRVHKLRGNAVVQRSAAEPRQDFTGVRT